MTANRERKRKLDRFNELTHQISMQTRALLIQEWPEHELSMPQFKLLNVLATGGKRMGEIARALDINLSAATNLVDRLERKGLVSRSHDRGDRRVVTCSLTAEGNRTVSTFRDVGRQQMEAMTGHLSDDEFDTVIEALEFLARSWQRTTRESVEPECPSPFQTP